MIFMMVLVIVNLVLDFIFIVWFDMGLVGVGWVIIIVYCSVVGFISWYFFVSGCLEMKIII